MTASRVERLPQLVARTVTAASQGFDDNGYPFVWLQLDDGTELMVKEISQTGEIKVAIDGHDVTLER